MTLAAVQAPIVSDAATAEPDPTRDPSAQTIEARQRAADPGPGYRFATSGPCEGTWEDLDSDACVHADFAPSSAEMPPDPVEPLDPEYEAEVAGGTNYCTGADPGNRFRVLYVTTRDGPSRFQSLESTLRSKARTADFWVWKSARATGDGRHVRYVCTAGEQIQITREILPNNADDSLFESLQELRSAGMNAPNRKYIAFAEWIFRPGQGGPEDPDVCGYGEMIAGDDGPNQTNQNNQGKMIGFVYLRACDGNGWAATMMHEIGHLLGAVQPSAPRHDDENRLHPRDRHDVMAYGPNTFLHAGCTNDELRRRYDCNHNDYFHTDPNPGSYLDTHWNAADNQFLVGGGG